MISIPLYVTTASAILHWSDVYVALNILVRVAWNTCGFLWGILQQRVRLLAPSFVHLHLHQVRPDCSPLHWSNLNSQQQSTSDPGFSRLPIFDFVRFFSLPVLWVGYQSVCVMICISLTILYVIWVVILYQLHVLQIIFFHSVPFNFQLTLLRYISAKGFPRWLSGKESTCNGEDVGSVPESGRSPREGNGNPLQYCLGNPMDRETWWATVHGSKKELDSTQRLNNNKFLQNKQPF